MKLGFLTAAFPDLTLEQVASWAASEGFETLEIACWPAAGGERRRYASITHIASTRSTPTRCTSSSARTGSRSPRSPTTEQPPSRRGPREEVNAHLRKVVDAAQALGVSVVGTFAGNDQTKSPPDNLRALPDELAHDHRRRAA